MTERTPAVAVIIITHNGEKYLQKSLASVLNQSFTNLEVVVVEDGTRDGAEAIVAASNDARARYVWQDNAGPSAARNTGIAHSTAPLIAFLDVDDWWGPDKIAAQVEALERSPNAGTVYSAANMVAARTGQIIVDPAVVVGDALPSLLVRNSIPGSASSVMARRDVLERVGRWDESRRYAEDWELWLRLAKAAPFARVERPDVFINVRPGSLGRDTENLRLAAHALINETFATVDPAYWRLKRAAHADVEFGASIDLAHHGRRRKAMVPLLRAIRYDPLRQRFWRRLVLLVATRIIPSKSLRARIVVEEPGASDPPGVSQETHRENH
jgi:glycosyltransferase involved in cell wall biosynthesis